MAFRKKKVTIWSVIGSLWTVFYLCLVLIVTIPDYPRTGQLWYNLTVDPNGYFHELWCLTVGFLSGLAVILVTRFWMGLASFLESIESVLVLPDGRIAFVRKRRKAPRTHEEEKRGVG